jgi:hypothetical protein
MKQQPACTKCCFGAGGELRLAARLTTISRGEGAINFR